MSHAPSFFTKPAALIVAHPGHELRLHGWLQRTRPWVGVLTDGSGHADRSRLDSTTALLHNVGARPLEIYGRFTDRALYVLLLAGDAKPFCQLAEELARALVTRRIQYVVSDASEGYNPVHDMCRVLTDTAVRLVETRGGPHIDLYDFPLSERPDFPLAERRFAPVVLHLDDEAFARKRAAAAAYDTLAGEIDSLLAQWGEEVFRLECLRLVKPWERWNRVEPPEYERIGSARIAMGRYQQVIRYWEHIAPLTDALRRFAETPA